MEDIRSELVGCQSGLEIINKIWMLQNNIQLKVFAFLWRWWSARNKANDGGRMPTATEICGSVSFFLMQFEKLHETKERVKSVPQGSWTPPPDNIYVMDIVSGDLPLRRA